MLFRTFQFLYYPRNVLRFQKQMTTVRNQSNGIQPIPMSFKEYVTGTEGNSPPIVIMHGLFGSKNNWHSLSKAINQATRRKVFALDARNHGESPHTDDFSYEYLAVDIDSFITHQIGSPLSCLIGHSMGGRAMMLFALNNPSKVEKLIVVDISPLQSSSKMYAMQDYFDLLRSIEFDKNKSLPEERKKADQLLSQNIKELEVRQFLLTNLIKLPNGEFKWKVNLDSLQKHFQDRIAVFPKTDAVCNKPTLFIGGTKSDYLNPDHHDEIKKLFPQAIFVYLNAGHWVHAEQPHEFIQTVSDFARS